MHPEDPRKGQARPRRAATILESVEEIRSMAARTPPGAREDPRFTTRDEPPKPGLLDTPGSRAGPEDTLPYRPLKRPPVAILCVLDDGDTNGEVVRLRASSFVIGRAEGDFLIPHDSEMSGRHAEIARSFADGRYRWALRDLQSMNGTFVRASSSILKDQQEILLGGCRLRFNASAPSAPLEAGPATGPASTLKWQVAPATGRPPGVRAGLVVLTPQGEGRRYPLIGDQLAIGRDPSRCTVVIDDPMVSPLHARIGRDELGRWVIHNERSHNGLWVRIQEMALERSGQFQCGEQRFLIRIPERSNLP